jgi:hypothetical protein
MSETEKKPTLLEIMEANNRVSRQDRTKPFEPREVRLATMPDDEDENTAAKSIVDEIIKETENESIPERSPSA